MTPERDAVTTMLAEAGVAQGDTLVVHSGFRGLSRAGHRAEAFIEALLAHLEGGTLLMPAMSWRIVTPDWPVWNAKDTPSHVGALPEIFRTRYAQARSTHPTHSVCGFGPGVAALLADPHCGDTPCAATSPWGRLAACNARILLLGTGFETCTALHHPEEVVAPHLYLEQPEQAAAYRCTAADSTVCEVRLRRHLRLNRDFPAYEGRIAARGALRSGSIDGVRWMAAAARDLMAEAFASLERHPAAHISPSAAPERAVLEPAA